MDKTKSASDRGRLTQRRTWGSDRVHVAGLLGVLVAGLSAATLARTLSDDPFSPHVGHGVSWAAVSWDHPLGTNALEQDVWTQLLLGSQTTLLVSLVAMASFVTVGTAQGLVTGYYTNGLARSLLVAQRMLGAFPILLLLLLSVIVVDATLGGRPTLGRLALLMLLFGVYSSPKLAEIVRGRTLALRERTFIEAAVSLGLSERRIIGKHILWLECRPLILVQAAYIMGQAIFIEATLTYLGFGVEFPMVSLGNMLRSMSDAAVGWGIVGRQALQLLGDWHSGRVTWDVSWRELASVMGLFHWQPVVPMVAIAGAGLLFWELARRLNTLAGRR